MNRRAICSTILALVVLVTTTAMSSAVASAAPAAERQRYIIRFADGVGARAGAEGVRRAGGEVEHVLRHVFDGAVALASPDAARRLAENPRVAAVEADGAVSIDETQTNPVWGLDRIDQRARPLSGSYTYGSSGTGVSAYVLDTGIRADHVDLAGRVRSGWTGYADGNGTNDCHGHGTHVAGTLGGTTYGVAKTVDLVAVRVLGCDGRGSWSTVITGLDWAVGDHAPGAPAVLNMSIGGSASSSLDTAVQAAVNDGISVVVSAGNANVDACTQSPARAPSALTVAASDSADKRASFSNFGSCVDVFAPGVSIVSAGISSTTATTSKSGTSMSAPHVAGVAAVMLSVTNVSPGEVAVRLTSDATTDVVTDVNGSPNLLLYVEANVEVAPEPEPEPAPEPAPETEPAPELAAPDAPTDVTAAAGKRSATVSWQPGSDGGSALTGQTVRAYAGGTAVTAVSVDGTATSVKVPRLKPGVSYTFTVSATNAVGTSPESIPSNAVEPRK